jgi:hypothetical protein
MKHLCAVMATFALGAITLTASSPDLPASISDRVRGSEQVVVATISDLRATYESNEFGDRLIVSHAKLQVNERLKGNSAQTVDVDILGGTIGDITLDVSAEPHVNRGDRAVFFLEHDQRTGRMVPHLHGQGVLMLDANDRVRGTSLDLNTIRATAAAVAGR